MRLKEDFPRKRRLVGVSQYSVGQLVSIYKTLTKEIGITYIL